MLGPGIILNTDGAAISHLIHDLWAQLVQMLVDRPHFSS